MKKKAAYYQDLKNAPVDVAIQAASALDSKAPYPNADEDILLTIGAHFFRGKAQDVIPLLKKIEKALRQAQQTGWGSAKRASEQDLTLRQQIIRLAHGQPHLRPHLLPLLREAESH